MASISSKYNIDFPKRNGGLAINIMPMPTKNTLSMSTLKMGSFIKSLAKNTVYNGEVAVIIITSANGKCWNYIWRRKLESGL